MPTVATSKARRERRQPRKNSLLSAKDKITAFVVVIFFHKKRDSNKEGKAKGFRKKTVRWTVFAYGGNEHSEAREATASEKSLVLRHKDTGLTGGLS